MTSLMGNVTRWPVSITHGDGPWLIDADGQRYLDLIGGIAVSVLGHAHPALRQAIATQAGRVLHVSNLYSSDELTRLADRLVGLLGAGRVYLCNSGTEANEAAIKLARKAAWRAGDTDRTQIVAFEGSFHGRTLGALAATMQPAKWEGFGPMPADFVGVPVDDPDALDTAIGPRTAAMLVEVVQGEAGIRVVDPQVLERAAGLCREHGALLVVDEIQTGMGRTGRWWGFEHHGLRPDIVTVGKGLGGGVPIAATWAVPHVADAFQPSDHGTTIGGNPLCCAAALAVLDVIEAEGLVERAEELGALIDRTLGGAGPVRGMGCLKAVELDGPRAHDVAARALEAGVLVNDVTPSAIRVAPPLTIDPDVLRTGLGTLLSVIDGVRHA